MSGFKVGDKVSLRVIDKHKLGTFREYKNKIGVVERINGKSKFPLSVYFVDKDETFTFLSNGYWSGDEEHDMYIVKLDQESFEGNS